MSSPGPRVGFLELASSVDLSIRSEEVRRSFAGVDFVKFREKLAGAGGTAPFRYTAGAHGFELSCDANGSIKLIALFGPGVRPDVHPYRGGLPGGITFQSSPGEVREALGPPSKSGPEQLVPILGRVGPWDRFDRSTFSLHVQYDPRGRQISVVTLLATDRIP